MPLVFPGEEVSLNEPGRTFARHHHLKGYAALIVCGACNEAGDRGRFRAFAGDVLVHLAFEAHQDQIGPAGAKIINFPIEEMPELPLRLRRRSRFRRAPSRAGYCCRRPTLARSVRRARWSQLRLARLARARALASQSKAPRRLGRASRTESELTQPRVQAGLRRNAEEIPFRTDRSAGRLGKCGESFEALSMIAAGTGFADQAHMTRAMAQLFGVTPRRLRTLS